MLVQIPQRRADSDVLQIWHYMRICYSYVQQVLWSQRYVLSIRSIRGVCSSVHGVFSASPNAPVANAPFEVWSTAYMRIQSMVHGSVVRQHGVHGRRAAVYSLTAVS